MSRITYTIFFAAVALLLFSVIFQLPIAAGGGAVVMMVGLIYAFIVTKREIGQAEDMGEDAPAA